MQVVCPIPPTAALLLLSNQEVLLLHLGLQLSVLQEVSGAFPAYTWLSLFSAYITS